MTRSNLSMSFPWIRYSRKLSKKIEKPRSGGFFTSADAQEREMHLAEGSSGSIRDGNYIQMYWLVDPGDGEIVDARFQVFGQSALIGAAEAACELLIGKNYDQARRVGADLIDKQVEDFSGQQSFPRETAAHLNLVVEAIDNAAEKCLSIPLPNNYAKPPVSFTGEFSEGGYPGWKELTLKEKLALIEQVIAADIRPYIELDAGGIEVLNLLNDREVMIAYSGACTSCFSATGATLSYIQQVLKAKLSPDLIVVPDL